MGHSLIIGCGTKVYCRHFDTIQEPDRQTSCGQFCINQKCRKQVFCEECKKK